LTSAAAHPITPEQVLQAYNAADSFVREVSNFRSDVAIPAQNELRYAGHHFMLAVADTANIDQDQLAKANNHCSRAMYEAADAGIISALDMIEIFGTDYKTVTILDIVPVYAEAVNKAKVAQSLLAQQRSDQEEDDVIIATPYVDIFGELIGFVEQLESGREDLNKKIAGGIRSYRRWIGGITIGVVVSVIGVVIGIILSCASQG
jgi:hypothetical protein